VRDVFTVLLDGPGGTSGTGTDHEVNVSLAVPKSNVEKREVDPVEGL
jgi:hypothetical protein